MKYPDSLKVANITPVHKKNDPTGKVRYRPVTILPLLLKIFERVIYNQLGDYMDSVLDNILCGLRRAHSTRHVSFELLQSWRKELDRLTKLVSLSQEYARNYPRNWCIT